MLNKSLLLASVSLLLVGTAAVAFPEPLPPPTRSSRAALKSAPAIPLAFEKNSGQASEDILYLANGNGRAVALKADHASMHIKDVPKPFVMRWAGAAKEVEIEALEEMYFTKNYHIGADENAWVNDVHSYGRVRYHEVYPNIDLDFYSLDGKLEYDFIVHPGGDPSQIALRFEGTEAKLDAEGALRLEAVEGAVWHAPPYVYQEDNGERREIRGAFRKGGETFGFDVGEYDQQANLVIDPVFAMVSFVGGTGRDLLLAGLFDSQGDLWVVGQTDSIDLSEKGGGGGTDALLAAYGNNGDDIAQNWEIGALTVFGGSGADSAKDITQGPDGNLFIGGDTNSPNFFEDGPALGSDVWTTREQISEVRFQLIQRLIARRTGVGDQTFGGFVRPCHPATGGAFDTWDPDGNGDDDIFYFGTVNLSGQPPFNNITQLDAETLEILREWHLLPRGNSGQADIGGIGFDPYTGEMIFAGSSNVDLFGANKLGVCPSIDVRCFVKSERTAKGIG